jgi:zinc/manganese transport system permease protein
VQRGGIALVIGALLTEFSDLRLIRVVQGAALLTLGLNLVAAFAAMGTLMAVGVMMLPAIAARHWAMNVGGIVYAACAIAVLAVLGGLAASFWADMPAGPAIVLAAGALWATSMLAGPVDGLWARWRRRHLTG